jgi:hypothetical protein
MALRRKITQKSYYNIVKSGREQSQIENADVDVDVDVDDWRKRTM